MTRAQLHAIGCTDRMISRRSQRGVLVRLYRGVYRVPGAPRTWYQGVLGACLAAGPGAAASHRCAAALHGLDGFRRSTVELVVPRQREPSLPGIRILRTRLQDGDVVSVGPIPTTSPTRTLLDLARCLPPRRLTDVFDELCRRRLIDPASLLDASWRPPFRRATGVGALRAIATDHLDGEIPRSKLERRFLDLVEGAGFPEPARQYPIRLTSELVQADFAYPHVLVAIELDGEGFHMSPDRFHGDRARYTELVVAGWKPMLFTWRHLTREPDAVVRRLDAVLGGRVHGR